MLHNLFEITKLQHRKIILHHTDVGYTERHSDVHEVAEEELEA
jgi:hypothetical protein